MEELKYKVCNKKLCDVVSCLVVEEKNTIQIAKNRNGNNRFDEIKDLDFIKVTKDEIKSCDNIIEKFHGKNVWYLVA